MFSPKQRKTEYELVKSSEPEITDSNPLDHTSDQQSRQISTSGKLHRNPKRDPDWESTIDYPAIAYLEMKDGKGSYSGSGALIKIKGYENLFITAGHNVFNDEKQQLLPKDLTVYFSYHEKGSNDQLVGDKYDVAEIIEAIDDENKDYAILRLSGEPSKKYNAMELSFNQPEPKSKITIAHHPDGEPKRVSSGEVIGNENNKIFYDLDTEHGSSGSAIIQDGKVIGIHTTDGSCKSYHENDSCDKDDVSKHKDQEGSYHNVNSGYTNMYLLGSEQELIKKVEKTKPEILVKESFQESKQETDLSTTSLNSENKANKHQSYNTPSAKLSESRNTYFSEKQNKKLDKKYQEKVTLIKNALETINKKKSEVEVTSCCCTIM